MRYIVLMVLLLSSSLGIAQKINASWQIHAANLYHYNVDGKVERQEEITFNLPESTFHNVPIAWDFGPKVTSEIIERVSDIEIPKGLMMQTIGSTSFFAYSIEDDRIILYYLLPGQGYLPGQSFAFRFENEWLMIDYPMTTTSSSGSISVLTCKYSRIP